MLQEDVSRLARKNSALQQVNYGTKKEIVANKNTYVHTNITSPIMNLMLIYRVNYFGFKMMKALFNSDSVSNFIEMFL